MLSVLGEEPMDKFRFHEGPSPDVVPHSRVLRVFRPTASLPNSSNHLPGFSDWHHRVTFAMENPKGHSSNAKSDPWIPGSAEQNRGCKQLWLLRDQIPSPIAAIRLTDDVNPSGVNVELYFEVVQQFQNKKHFPGKPVEPLNPVARILWSEYKCWI